MADAPPEPFAGMPAPPRPGPRSSPSPPSSPALAEGSPWRLRRFPSPSPRARRAALVGLVALPLALPFAFAVDEGLRAGRVHRGVRVGGVEVGGLARIPAEQAVGALGERLLAREIRALVAGREVRATGRDLALRVDAGASAARALEAGRGGTFFKRFGFWLARFASPFDVPVTVRADAPAVERVLGSWEREALSDLVFEGAVAARGGAFEAEPPRPGRRIARGPAKEALLEAAGRPEAAAPPDLALERAEPRRRAAVLEEAARSAEARVGAPIELAAPAEEAGDEKEKPGADPVRLVFSPAELRAAMRVREPEGDAAAPPELHFDVAAVEAKIAKARPLVERPPESARFSLGAKDEISIVPSSSGVRLEAERVARALFELSARPADPEDGVRRGALPLSEGERAEVTTDDLRGLGIARLVAKYTTRHKCCEKRVENIHRIADLLDGIVVPPGATLSVNEVVGPRTRENGFFPAPTIEDGEMVDTIGGGVSQFATTLFNAAFYGGYDIVERKPHSYYFRRYPEGYDATLSFPKPDVVVRNDTDAGMLVHSEYTGTSITVKIFGENGGRKVTAKVGPRHDVTKPPVELFPDDELEPDDEKVREGGAVGWSVNVTRTILFSDGTKKEERRKVTYRPRVRRVDVHPCKIPKGKPGHTGDPCPEPEPPEEDASAAGALIGEAAASPGDDETVEAKVAPDPPKKRKKKRKKRASD